ncbi:MAG: hypothetical protein KJ561_05590 [Nanoarchaeota archaeon]|nr:hypothetical protein [Nanoarchaeota archaeon]
MPNQINLVIGLICHHGDWDDFKRDARVIQRVSFEKRVPVTYLFSGMELDAIANNRGKLCSELGFDIVGAMQSNHFISPRFGHADAHKPELGIMPYNHIPLVHPWAQHLWGEYFEGILQDQIRWSQGIAEQMFHKTPVTIHPPDGVYAPAAAHALRGLGFDTVVVSGEFLGSDRHSKGILYWASGLRHLMRTNDIQPQDDEFQDARHLVDRVEQYGHENDMPFVTITCDIDEFNGMRGMGDCDGIARLCCIGDEAYKRGGRVQIVNANAAAHWNMHSTNVETAERNTWPWNDVHAQIHGDGGLGWIEGERNWVVGHVVWLIGERYRQGWEGGVIQRAKEHLWMAADIACRNKYFQDGLSCYFWENIRYAKQLLNG